LKKIKGKKNRFYSYTEELTDIIIYWILCINWVK
jgi:hypothetical protein